MSLDDFWKRVSAYVAHIDEYSYYDLLRVSADASHDQLTDAFYQLSRHLHPDRYAREADARRIHALNVIYARIREAYTVLTDPRTRRRYDEQLAAGHLRYDHQRRAPVREPDQPENPKARMFYQLGHQLLNKRDLRGARAQFELALQLEPHSELIRKALDSFLPSDRRLQRAATAAPVAVAEPERQPAPAPKPTPKRSSIQGFTTLVSSSPSADAVGIDFGTSYTSVSIGIGNKLYTVPDPYSRTLHPSVVHIQPNGLPLCGWSAREKLISAPRQTVASPKRLLGRRYSDNAVAGMLQSASFRASAGPDDSVLVEIDSRQYAIAQICGQIISHVRELAERSCRRRIERAVMSVPVTFDDEQRELVRRTAKMAGVEVLAFLDEPVAAAMAYGFGQGKDEVVAVYDFGGGTFDFTVLDINGYSFKVLARGGDSWLGGDDFDLAIANAVADALWRRTNVEVRDRAVEWQRLLFACERTKRQLSEADTAALVVENLFEHPQRINLRQRVGRDLLERLCSGLVDRSLAICKNVLGQVGLDPRDMNQVIVSGGVSRIPFVRTRLGQFFHTEIRDTVNPDEAICLGAGFRAAQLSKFPVTGIGFAA